MGIVYIVCVNACYTVYGDSMEQEYVLLQAIKQCEEMKGKRLRYEGEDHYCQDQIGEISVLYDQNCCAPTQDVLFAFVMENQRQRIMSGEECISFLADCHIVSNH